MTPLPHALKKGFLLLFISVAAYSCVDNKAQRIVDDAIKAHGGDVFATLNVGFEFRDRSYTAFRNKGVFTYTREFTDSTGKVRDVLNNSGFERFVNGKKADITEERRKAFTNSVNSVIYFALLPFGLNDDAVNKKWIDETTIKGEPYDIVHVTFDQSGGGEDHQDEFLYWIHQETHTMDYFAYSYETEGGGLRFREATISREIGGIRFQDYANYRPKDESIPLNQIQALFTSGELEKLSEINLRNIKVMDLDNSDH
jgi:hypothetical protein